MRPDANRVLTFVFLGLPVLLCLILLTSNLYSFFSIETLAASSLFSFLCELYLFLFTFSLDSISANIVITTNDVGVIDHKIIDTLYDSREMVLKRYNRLLSNGLLVLVSAGTEGEGYEITTKGDRLLTTMNKLRSIFKHE
jgi:predicted transcriptional regulator